MVQFWKQWNVKHFFINLFEDKIKLHNSNIFTRKWWMNMLHCGKEFRLLMNWKMSHICMNLKLCRVELGLDNKKLQLKNLRRREIVESLCNVSTMVRFTLTGKQSPRGGTGVQFSVEDQYIYVSTMISTPHWLCNSFKSTCRCTKFNFILFYTVIFLLHKIYN